MTARRAWERRVIPRWKRRMRRLQERQYRLASRWKPTMQVFFSSANWTPGEITFTFPLDG